MDLVLDFLHLLLLLVVLLLILRVNVRPDPPFELQIQVVGTDRELLLDQAEVGRVLALKIVLNHHQASRVRPGELRLVALVQKGHLLSEVYPLLHLQDGSLRFELLSNLFSD